MANQEYRLTYKTHDDVVFPSKTGMKRYLTQEKKAWSPFLTYLRKHLGSDLYPPNGRHLVTPDQLATAYETLTDKFENRDSFNLATKPYHLSTVIPPSSDSLEGQLIIGLFDADMATHALSAYLHYIVKNYGVRLNNDQSLHKLDEQGKILIEAAPIVKALPYSRASNSKMAGVVRTAENHVRSLADEVAAAQDANAEHAQNLDAFLDGQREQAQRLNNIIRRLNRRRDRQYKLLTERAFKIFEKKVKHADQSIRALELKSQKAEQDRVSEFERLQSIYRSHLELRAPAAQWGKREQIHKTNSRNAFRGFLGIGALTICFGLGVPFYFGDYIADSFFQLHYLVPATEEAVAQECARIFSAKGPITITGLLLAMSLLMWMARLQYRIHLSERHLALDASEKKAFAETYLAMKESRTVNNDNEAIVLASLFRPTQDGIIRDDESGMDISAVTLMAKQFSRSN